ncbi:serpentine type 7TM GPCR chemoreceptor srsx domain-containing protein [Ditylenchus destructor]|uniref:Serpentine type 7TM GPCR chemoreceptor srsx domain-containing protein n=1 Tax=Ditylenchus destructor TaxID=166010 RepID=A0AAD4N8A0_9BILA|nr:serpentine type 7TM GPCR chemoreceptor srsx domain-containing protein [Ditylenchus destructor]
MSKSSLLAAFDNECQSIPKDITKIGALDFNGIIGPQAWQYCNNRDGFSPSLFTATVPLYITAMIGALCNVSVIYVTFRYRSLNNSYNYLLATTALSDILHQISYNVSMWHMITGQNMIDFLDCFYLQSYAVVGMAMSYVCIFLTAVDRLVSIVFPIWHRSVPKAPYVAFLIFLSLAFSTYVLYYGFVYAKDHPNWPVICMHTVCYLGPVATLMFWSCVTFNVFTIAVYLITWFLLRNLKRYTSGQAVTKTRKIFKSLAIIMISVLLGWMFNAMLEIVLQYCQVNGALIWFITRLGAMSVNIVSGITAPVLYFCSTDYKNVYDCAFRGRKVGSVTIIMRSSRAS